MLIAGVHRLTLLDFPGITACTVFTAGCNFRCPYCHNSEMVFPERFPEQMIPDGVFFNFLKKRQGLLEGVCITGGEPTMQKDLGDFVRQIKEFGFKVKLDTNGTNPNLLEELYGEGLLDYVAMDIKSAPDNYDEIAGVSVVFENIERSRDLIMNSGVDYEFRTTVLPRFHNIERVRGIGEFIRGAKRHYLQQFRGVEFCLDESFANERSFGLGEMEELAECMREYVERCEVRS
ncbi:MAG: anaerobic ribonucleoside-triphosphate reductase activating protein [Candidatus Gracilibacteria bacterium]|nr:anaerobic ribonucleoside-triphosphate reductase activating protein [Candidatus Gracilibacteria bacterium]